MLAKNVNPKANNIRVKFPDCEAKSMDARIPILAASNVPAVVGATNRFWVICCMISPQMLIPTPARISATVRGIRLMLITNCCSSVHRNKSETAMSFTPTKSEITANAISANIKYSSLKLFRIILNSKNRLYIQQKKILEI